MKSLTLARSVFRNFRAALFFLIIFVAFSAGCSDGMPNRLVGHTYLISPVSLAYKMRLGFTMSTIEHEYKSNNEVLITTYAGTEAIKKESMSYSLDDSDYTMGNEHYNVTFAGDAAIFSVNGDVLFRLEPLK